MALTQQQKDQIILTARTNKQMTLREISEQHNVSSNSVASIVAIAKRKMGKDFYIGGGSRPTPNYSLVLGCLERSPNKPVSLASIKSLTGLGEVQIISAVDYMRTNLNLEVTRHGEKDGRRSDCYFIYTNQSRVRVKPRWHDVFGIMNQLDAA